MKTPSLKLIEWNNLKDSIVCAETIGGSPPAPVLITHISLSYCAYTERSCNVLHKFQIQKMLALISTTRCWISGNMKPF